jgi:hypothetical protein
MPDSDIEQRIRERAFYIWIEQGQPEGKDREHWEQAESELMAGIAAPQSQVEGARRRQPASCDSAQSGPVQAESIRAESVQTASAIDAIKQVKYAAARDVDQGSAKPVLEHSRSATQTWDSYQSAAQSWDYYKQRCGGY